LRPESGGGFLLGRFAAMRGLVENKKSPADLKSPDP